MLDRFIARMPAEQDGDLMLCEAHGVAFQADRMHAVEYGEEYFDRCAGYEGAAIADRINAARVALVERHFGTGEVLDIGVGSGEFVRRRPNTYGFDVNPKAVAWLKANQRWSSSIGTFGAFTFWDVIEHVPDPGHYLERLAVQGCVFASIPVFESLREIRASRHYRPGEHLYYWTERGFVEWMDMHGFALLEVTDDETRAGRESIKSFAFRRVRWPKL